MESGSQISGEGAYPVQFSKAGIVGSRSEMEDDRIHDRIEQLVAEEHELFERAAQGTLNESSTRRPAVRRMLR